MSIVIFSVTIQKKITRRQLILVEFIPRAVEVTPKTDIQMILTQTMPVTAKSTSKHVTEQKYTSMNHIQYN